MAARIGNFIIFLILSLVTLGIYPLYFFVTRQQENTELLKEILERNKKTKLEYETITYTLTNILSNVAALLFKRKRKTAMVNEIDSARSGARKRELML